MLEPLQQLNIYIIVNLHSRAWDEREGLLYTLAEQGVRMSDGLQTTRIATLKGKIQA